MTNMCLKNVGLDLINLRSGIRAVRVGKSSEINKHKGTFISDSRVQVRRQTKKTILHKEWPHV